MVESLQCVSGMLIDDPRLSISPFGRCRFTAPIEVPLVASGRHAENPARTVASLVMVGPVAERAYAQFTEGDRFLAVGAWILLDASDQEVGGVEFFARHLGHDLAQHRYAVDRTRRRGWQPHAPVHLLATDWAAPLLRPSSSGSVAP